MPSIPTPLAPRPLLPFPRESVDDFLSRPSPGAIATVARTPGPFLVLGAGGKLGLHLSVMLRAALDQLGRTDRVIAVSRFTTLRDRADFESRGVETCPCDLSDPVALAALPDAPTVFFLAGVKFGTSTAPDLLHAVNVELPAQVADRFRASRIIAFSSGCVYPFVAATSGGATEAMPTAPVGDYAASCLAREQAFAAASLRHGNPIALIRLNYSVEFRYGLLVDLAESVLAGRPIDVTTGYFNIIWQPDALAHCIQSLELAGTPAVPVNITGPDTLSVRAIAHRFGEIFGRPVVIRGSEAPTAWLNNAALSHRRFGLPATSVESQMQWIATWLLNDGETWGKPTGFERRDGRF